MAIKQWKTFLMPYQQAVEELKIKFKSIRTDMISLHPMDKLTGYLIMIW